MLTLQVMDHVLCNGRTGIFDLNVTLPQTVLGGSAYVMGCGLMRAPT